MSNFFAYTQTGNMRYRESFGLNFEDFRPGQVFYHRPGITLSQQDNKNEALETINNAMLHYDANYAAHTEWKLCLGVSTLTLQIVLGCGWKTFYKKSHIKTYHNIAMTHPVFGGDTLYATTTILGVKSGSLEDLGEIEIMTEASNQNQQTVAKIHYTLLIYKKGKFPEDKYTSANHKSLNQPKFYAYHPHDKGLMEQFGLYYEDLEVGEIYEHRPGKTFFEAEVWQHATHSGEWHPCFTNKDYLLNYCNSTKLHVPDAYLLGVATTLTTRSFGRVVANLGWINTQIFQRVIVGDSLYAESKILEKRESHSRPSQGIIKAETLAFNQNNEKILSFERSFLIYKKDQGPFEQAGY